MGAVAHDSPLQILIDEDFLFIFLCIFSLQIHIANKFNGRLEAFMKKIRDYEVKFDSRSFFIVSYRIMKKNIFTV